MRCHSAPILLALGAAAMPGLGTASEAQGDCTDVTFIRNQFWGHSRAVVAELLIKERSESEFRVRGLLFNGDWGKLRMCTAQFELRVRWMIDPLFPKVFSRKNDDRGTLQVHLGSRDPAYIVVAPSLGEVKKAEAEEDIGRLERRSEPGLLAREDLDRNRYFKICGPECSDKLRPPDASGLRD